MKNKNIEVTINKARKLLEKTATREELGGDSGIISLVPELVDVMEHISRLPERRTLQELQKLGYNSLSDTIEALLLAIEYYNPILSCGRPLKGLYSREKIFNLR